MNTITLRRYTASDAQAWDELVRRARNGTFLLERRYMDYHADRFRDHSLLYYDRRGRLVAVLPANEVSMACEAVARPANDVGMVCEAGARPVNVESEACMVGARPAIEVGMACEAGDRLANEVGVTDGMGTVAEADESDAPAELYSHQGLTYGGLVMGFGLCVADVVAAIGLTVDYLHRHRFRRWVYKSMPYIYGAAPAEDAEYALWRVGAVQTSCLISTTIDLHAAQPVRVSPSRRHHLKVGQEQGWTLEENAPLSDFWPVMVANLQARYHVSPVHTLAEMELLQSRFPRQIRCLVVRRPGAREVLGGVVLYLCGPVVHVQYGHATPEGRQLDVMDFIYLSLIERFRRAGQVRYFDFGNSNERQGHYLNESLIAQKEGFGGRGVVYRTWAVDVAEAYRRVSAEPVGPEHQG